MREPRRVNVVHVDFCINKASSGALELMRGRGGLQWFMILSKKTVRFGHSVYKHGFKLRSTRDPQQKDCAVFGHSVYESWVQFVKHQRPTAKRPCGLWSQCLRVMGSNRREAPETHSKMTVRSLVTVSTSHGFKPP